MSVIKDAYKWQGQLSVWGTIYEHLPEPRPTKDEFFRNISESLAKGDKVGVMAAAGAAAAAVRSGKVAAADVLSTPPPGLPDVLREVADSDVGSNTVTAETILATLLGDSRSSDERD